MASHGYSGRGSKKRLSKKLDIPYGTMVMALSGYRTSMAYVDALNKIQDHLAKKHSKNKAGLMPQNGNGVV